MKIKNKTIIVSCLMCLIPFIVSIIFYNELPNEVATHFNAKGKTINISKLM